MTRVEEIWLGAADFYASESAHVKPTLAEGRWEFPKHLRHGDGIGIVLPVGAGDRILSIEPDIDISLGLMLLELIVEAEVSGTITSLLKLENKDMVGSSRGRQTLTYSVRRTVPKGRLWLRIEAQNPELEAGHERFVFGAALRIARSRAA